MRHPHGCLIALIIWLALGAILYNLPGTDPEGDGGGAKFIGVTFFAVLIIGGVRWVINASQNRPVDDEPRSERLSEAQIRAIAEEACRLREWPFQEIIRITYESDIIIVRTAVQFRGGNVTVTMNRDGSVISAGFIDY